jgi:hypothetical protein
MARPTVTKPTVAVNENSLVKPIQKTPMTGPINKAKPVMAAQNAKARMR